MLSGLLTALTIRHLPGNAGHSPAIGFNTGGGPPIEDLRAVEVLAALATLSLGAVLGPEAPLIAIGGGLGALAVQPLKQDAPPAMAVTGAAGSFAAISTLLGSPLLGAFLIMEAAGVSGTTLEPGGPARPAGGRHRLADLRRSGRWTGFGMFLAGAYRDIPEVRPDGGESWPGRW